LFFRGDAQFDGVVTRLAVHHFARPQRALEEIFRVLRPGVGLSLRLPRVYAITDRSLSGADPSAVARRLFAVGVRCLQVREKSMPDPELLVEVESVARLGKGARALVLVNDRVDLARIASVGVHLGEEDLPASVARSILGREAAIGVSTHDLSAARREFGSPESDYVAFGPVFESVTKGGRRTGGLAELARVAAQKTKPLVAIGGITAERLEAVWDAGAASARAPRRVRRPASPPGADASSRSATGARSRTSACPSSWTFRWRPSGRGCLARRIGPSSGARNSSPSSSRNGHPSIEWLRFTRV